MKEQRAIVSEYVESCEDCPLCYELDGLGLCCDEYGPPNRTTMRKIKREAGESVPKWCPLPIVKSKKGK